MLQQRFTLEQLEELREEARLASPGITSLQQAQADRELRVSEDIKGFLAGLLPLQRRLILFGKTYFTIPVEVYRVLNADERLAVYLGKGHFSWFPSRLVDFERELRGSSRELIPAVYEWANGLLKDSLKEFPKTPTYRADPLEARLQSTSRRSRLDLERGFFRTIRDPYDSFNSVRDSADGVYKAVTSYS